MYDSLKIVYLPSSVNSKVCLMIYCFKSSILITEPVIKCCRKYKVFIYAQKSICIPSYSFSCLHPSTCSHTTTECCGRSVHCSVTQDRHCKTSKACFHLFLVTKEVGGRLSPNWLVKLTTNVSEFILVMLGVGK